MYMVNRLVRARCFRECCEAMFASMVFLHICLKPGLLFWQFPGESTQSAFISKLVPKLFGCLFGSPFRTK